MSTVLLPPAGTKFRLEVAELPPPVEVAPPVPEDPDLDLVDLRAPTD